MNEQANTNEIIINFENSVIPATFARQRSLVRIISI